MTPRTGHATARPTQVTVAFWLQLTAALLLLTLVGAAVAYAVHFDGQISRAARLVPDADPAEVDGERAGNVISTLVIAVPLLVLGIWLAATAAPVLRGSGAARILVFVAGGGELLLCGLQTCGALLFVPFALTAAGAEPSTVDGEDADDWMWEESEFLETLYGEPDPFLDLLPLGAGLGTLLTLALLGTVILLLILPPAHRYFATRPVPPGAVWSGPPGGYPLAPTEYPLAPAGYPLVPGHPPYLAGQHPPPGPYPICPDPAAHRPPATPPRG